MTIDVRQLNYEERQSYNNLLKQAEVKRLTVEDLKNSYQNMLFSTVRELAETPWWKLEKNINLKARIKVYLLNYDLLTAPERISEQMKKAIEEFEKKAGGKND